MDLVTDLRQTADKISRRVRIDTKAEAVRKKLIEENKSSESAERIISLIPEICLQEARRCNRSAVVMHLDHLQAKIKNLEPIPKLVFQWCKVQNLRPTLKWNDNFSSDIGCYDLVVRW